ncbi:UNKNOWN [Stylonychia lemnae]|uniref:Uncharacterized protein n=1 Tax=Stylonychia lemnae TaxID=5949 RepID=A0A078B4H3_STYLE|nr:UNKNOWN [Stylonychia lemnae]|eukprot:CDW89171.1 UNKNOWN [Stylonychia lemnae]
MWVSERKAIDQEAYSQVVKLQSGIMDLLYQQKISKQNYKIFVKQILELANILLVLSQFPLQRTPIMKHYFKKTILNTCTNLQIQMSPFYLLKNILSRIRSVKNFIWEELKIVNEEDRVKMDNFNEFQDLEKSLDCLNKLDDKDQSQLAKQLVELDIYIYDKVDLSSNLDLKVIQAMNERAKIPIKK